MAGKAIRQGLIQNDPDGINGVISRNKLKNIGIDDLEASMNELKVDIANNTNTNFGITYYENTDYSNVSIEATDINQYR